jgi:putative transposase
VWAAQRSERLVSPARSWIDVREAGRTVNMHTAGYPVNAEGYREILGLHVTSTEDVAGWLAFVRTSRPPAWGRVASVAHRSAIRSVGWLVGSAATAWQAVKCG